MSKENDNERLSRLFDGELGGDIPSDINRENWEIYSLIGDSLRDGPNHLSRDISAGVRRSLEDTAHEPDNKGFWTNLLGNSLFGYLRSLWHIPKTGGYQFASVAIVFALGFSSNNIMNSFKGENVENFYVESGVKSVAILNPADQIESDCDISEIFIDELIMHHERLSGSSDLC
ncbi:sigma-E factor negative regulatory protein [Betaproteobacteria bacterium]|nr:sigma-E factor negative regulatory protein [Betaproteobacteria bacterium]